MKYRVSARGILEEEDKILFVEYKHKNMNTYYSLPGGGQEKGINLKQTVQIEFREEVAIEVEVGDVLLVREFIIDEPDIEVWLGGIHQVEIIFECKRNSSIKVDKNQLKPDFDMTGFKWIPIGELDKYKIFPCEELKQVVLNKRVNYLFEHEKTNGN